MKKRCILWLLMSVIGLQLIAQNIIYSNLKELLAQNGDTIAVLRVEKRSRNQIVLTGGADYPRTCQKPGPGRPPAAIPARDGMKISLRCRSLSHRQRRGLRFSKFMLIFQFRACILSLGNENSRRQQQVCLSQR